MPNGAGSPRLEAESAVDRRVDASTKEHLVSIRGWRGFNNPWMLEDEGDVEYSYINLLMNPERYTGYKVVFLPSACTVLYDASSPGSRLQGACSPHTDACTVLNACFLSSLKVRSCYRLSGAWERYTAGRSQIHTSLTPVVALHHGFRLVKHLPVPKG